MSDNTFEEDFVCFELPPPEEIQHDAFRASLSENPQNILVSSGALDDPTQGSLDGLQDGEPQNGASDTGTVALALNSGKLWRVGRTINIRFLGGSPGLQAKVRQQASTWTQFANLKFNWVKSGPAQIRIDFKQGAGSWSYVGSTNEQIKEPNPTMNYGWLTDKSNDEEIRRVVLHEFGHALGCVHEHQNPLTSIKWNVPKVLEEMAKPPNRWDKQKTQHNVLNKLKANEVRTRKFDPDSIMLYSYPATWMLGGGQGTKKNTVLSKEDKEWIKICYPANQTRVGAFSTLEVREWNSPDTADDFKDMAFYPPYQAKPKIALGLTWMDLDHSKDLSIVSEAANVGNDGFRVSIVSDKNSRLYTGGCTWLESVDETYDLQLGEFDTNSMKDKLPTAPTPNFTVRQEIVFPEKFHNKAHVVVWFSSLKLSKDHDWKVKAYTSHVSHRGFMLHIDVGNKTVLQGAKVTWIAYPEGRSDIVSGTISTAETTPRTQLKNQNSGSVEFPEGTFQEAPSIVAALNGIDIAKGHNLRVRLTNTAISNSGFAWHLDNWLDTVMYGASASYVASIPSATREME